MYRRIDSLDDQLKESESKIVALEDKIQVLETLEQTREFNKNFFQSCEEMRTYFLFVKVTSSSRPLRQFSQQIINFVVI